MVHRFTVDPGLSANSPAPFRTGPRRALVGDVTEILTRAPLDLSAEQEALWDDFDLIYRTLCGILYNYVPQSGHPGGSISSGRIAAGLVFNTLDYDFHDPNREEADLLSYAAGHKAMGLYALWALRNEIVRIARPAQLPAERLQLRLEDLLGFRRNPTQETPLFREQNAKALDGHPTPATPFVRLATGASGVGVPASLGLALGAIDRYRDDPPRVHILEGEGGLTPGRVHEALALASAAQLWNVILHVDWNQSSIDSDRVCRAGDQPGDYVQWDPVELGYLHDWNVITVEHGHQAREVLAAQQAAVAIGNRQPTMVVYRTTKGWRYGIEGRTSHGAGHKFCSAEYCCFLEAFEERFDAHFPRYEGEPSPAAVEAHYFATLLELRRVLEQQSALTTLLADGIAEAEERLVARRRRPHARASRLGKIYAAGAPDPATPPEALRLTPGATTTLRGELGRVLQHLNQQTGGAIIAAAADLLDSTSIATIGRDFGQGFYNAVTNPDTRLIATGGICEDAMGAFMAGLSSYGHHIGVSSSYGAFIAALEHIAARLHGIGQQAKRACVDEPFHPWVLVNAHAGIKTGEDGPTHADPQCLQLLQENFPRGILITLTPWDPAEVWPLVTAALAHRPAVLAPFVTRPGETVPDREALGLPASSAAVQGVYALREADPAGEPYHGTLVLQGSGVTTTFVGDVLPRIDAAGLRLNIYYVASAELFDLLPRKEQEAIYPAARAAEALGITGFTLPTLYRWVTSAEGRAASRHPFRGGRYLGSGQAHKVLEEAGLHAAGQWAAIEAYAEDFVRRARARR